MYHIIENTIRLAVTTCHDVVLAQNGEQPLAVSNIYTKPSTRDTSEASGFHQTTNTVAEAMQSELQENVFSGISNFWSMKLSDDEPQWKDVKVVAEFSKKTHKNERKAKFLKLSGYVGENLFVTIKGSNDDPTMQFQIEPKPIIQPQRLITRGSTCFETEDKLSVVKYAWTAIKGCSEIDFLKFALPVRSVVNYITSDEIYRTSHHLGSLDFTDADAWDLETETLIISRVTHLMQPTVSPWDRDCRLIRIAFTPRGQP
ncbi:BgTH12-01440 [Blumeria graminis f. sp. triticale]|uniref:BgTH12-01440 n=1 Tax=Blumeria graminis f. sp. triticale TaxID=1689686 RepID=A0A9W4GDX2_BLUGR|nr:BgTH12-01440 [Blumeria graminis f. sp. triticale]